MFKEFFYFPKSDRKGILAALLVATAAIVGVWLVGRSNSATEGEEGIEGEVEKAMEDGRKDNRYDATEGRTLHLQPFDPNLADSTQPQNRIYTQDITLRLGKTIPRRDKWTCALQQRAK